MVKLSRQKQEMISTWLINLQNKIKDYIENIDKGYNFEEKNWIREGGGGGKMYVIYGNHFEKMGVNVSEVYGELSKELANTMPIGENREFWASGLSLVSHPKNPFVPPIHMNVRCFSTADKIWFGGGLDLNPIYKFDEDTQLFHSLVKDICDKHDRNYYSDFSKECDEYFTLKHRNEKRGIGGIFFDYLENDFDKNWNFLQEVGNGFIPIYNIFVQRYINKQYTEDDRDYQLIRRGRYVEFNLLYDRGIKFGLMTGGNPDGMFMSLPPLVKWN